MQVSMRFSAPSVFKAHIDGCATPTPESPFLNFNFNLKLGMHLVLAKSFRQANGAGNSCPFISFAYQKYRHKDRRIWGAG